MQTKRVKRVQRTTIPMRILGRAEDAKCFSFSSFSFWGNWKTVNDCSYVWSKPQDSGSWLDGLTYTEKVKLHLSRALIMNPEVIVLQRPLHHYDTWRTTIDLSCVTHRMVKPQYPWHLPDRKDRNCKPSFPDWVSQQGAMVQDVPCRPGVHAVWGLQNLPTGHGHTESPCARERFVSFRGVCRLGRDADLKMEME